MAYRFTDTNKWGDSWFYKLKNLEKLLFIYLCDNCDIAGIIEVNERKWAFDLNAKETEIEAAIKGLSRGLIFSKDGDIIYLRNFLKHQKNLPLNPENKAHLGIIKRLEANLNKFDYQSINDYIQAPAKPLDRGTGIGSGNGNGLEEGGTGETKPKKYADMDIINKLEIEPLLVPVVYDWLKYKRTRGQSYKSEKSISLFISNLTKYSGGDISKARQIIEQSMANNWAGIFELKQPTPARGVPQPSLNVNSKWGRKE